MQLIFRLVTYIYVLKNVKTQKKLGHTKNICTRIFDYIINKNAFSYSMELN